jgi:hypothetical protein
MLNFRNKVRASLGAEPLPGKAGGEGEGADREIAEGGAEGDDTSSVCSSDEEVKDETSAQKLLNAARNKFIERRITGTITLSRLHGIVTHSLACEVTEDDIPQAVDEDLGDLGRLDKKMISVFDALINRLEKASKAWENHPYGDKVTITRSSELGFYLPVFLTVGFRIEICLEANVQSLVQSRLLRHRQKAFKAALKTIDHSLVEGVMQQGGFPLTFSQKAVIATENTSVEDALVWAVSKTPDEIAEFQKTLGGEEVIPVIIG